MHTEIPKCCPNCGAVITNFTNCEYCGSLLVRFVDKNINLIGTSYLDNAQVHRGLIDSLNKHLTMQSNNQNKEIETIIYRSRPYVAIIDSDIPIRILNSQEASGLYFGESRPDKKGIAIILRFKTTRLFADYATMIDAKRLDRFKQLDIYSLFEVKITKIDYLGVKANQYEYYIDFGLDSQGAARMLSKILVDIYRIKLEDNKIRFITDCKQANEVWEKREGTRKYIKTAILGSLLFVLSCALPVLLVEMFC